MGLWESRSKAGDPWLDGLGRIAEGARFEGTVWKRGCKLMFLVGPIDSMGDLII